VTSCNCYEAAHLLSAVSCRQFVVDCYPGPCQVKSHLGRCVTSSLMLHSEATTTTTATDLPPDHLDHYVVLTPVAGCGAEHMRRQVSPGLISALSTAPVVHGTASVSVDN